MTWNGYFTANGVEVINATRTEAYAKQHRLGWFKPIYDNTALPALIGDGIYTDPATDGAVWYEPNLPESAEFYGVYPLDVTGSDDSTFGGTVVESLTDGGTLIGSRNGTKSTVFNVVLVGASEAGVEYGLQWLKRALIGTCKGQLSSCVGFDLTYFASEPLLGAQDVGACGSRLAARSNDPAEVALRLERTLRRTQVLNGPVITAKRNTTDGGCVWSVGFTVASGSPFEFSREVLFIEDWLDPNAPSPWPRVLMDTNRATNPTFNTATTGLVSNDPARYVLSLGTTAPIAGAGSALTTRAATPTSPTASSVWLNGINNVTTGLSVEPGVPITGSVDVKTEKTSRTINAFWEWRNAANAVVLPNSATKTYSASAIGVHRVTVNATPPAGAAFGVLMVAVVTATGNAVSGEKVWYDRVKFGSTNTSTYFDGDTPDSGTTLYEWTGTPGASTSQKWDVQQPPGFTITGPVTYDGLDEECLPNETVPLYDPLCPGVMSPPPPPAIEWACYEGPVDDIWNRYTIVIPRNYIPGWQQVNPIIRLTTVDEESRNVRIRFYPDPLATGVVDPANPCGFDYEFIVSYLPAGGIMTIDGRDQVVYADVGNTRRRADSLVFASDGRPPDWSGLSCDQNYVMTVDFDPAQTVIPSIDLSFVERFG